MKIGNSARITAFVIYGLLVSLASLSPGSSVSIEVWDKLLHFMTYGLFAIVGFTIAGSSRTYLYVCLGIVAYSGLIEVGQSFIPGRFMSGYDLVANALGVTIGAILVRLLAPLLGRA